MRAVLLGGRSGLRLSSRVAWGFAVWLPVALMLAVIARESTPLFSAEHTGHWLRWIYQGIAGPVDDLRWQTIHHVLRKTGHFVGYGLLGLAWLRAWLLNWLGPLRLRSAGYWRTWSMLMALFCTGLVASLDELHQSFLPNRTGVPADVLLDCSGAVFLFALVAVVWRLRGKT